ncbi:MAG: hypothetical protein AB8F26_11415 [Phycisphaerales bacterium]
MLTRMQSPFARVPAIAIAAVLLTIPLGGCAGFGGGGSGGSGSIISESTGRELRLDLPRRATVVQDNNTADVYLTDLSQDTLDRIAAGESGPDISGTLVQVHIFLNPTPGKTPIEPTAANATARVIVVARGNVGVYDSAGFLLAGKSLDKNRAAGTLRNARARLTRSTDGFQDLLGAATLELSFSARPDQPTSDSIARVIRILTAAAAPLD